MGSKRFGSNNPEYNSAASNWQRAYDATSDAVNKYTGNAGYQNSIEQGKIGADYASRGAAINALGAARSAGVSKSRAATMGAEQGAKGYYDAFNSQQQQAGSLGTATVNAQNQLLQSDRDRMQSALQHKQDTYNYAWGNIGNTLGIFGSITSAMSDSNLKNYYNISEKYKRKK